MFSRTCPRNSQGLNYSGTEQGLSLVTIMLWYHYTAMAVCRYYLLYKAYKSSFRAHYTLKKDCLFSVDGQDQSTALTSRCRYCIPVSHMKGTPLVTFTYRQIKILA